MLPEPTGRTSSDSLVTWLCVIFVVATIGIGILVACLPLGVITIWFIYRIARGWLALNDRRPMYA